MALPAAKGAAAAAAIATAVTTVSAAPITVAPTTNFAAADGLVPGIGCQTVASATTAATAAAAGPGGHAPAPTMAAVTVARRSRRMGARPRVRRATTTPRLSSTNRALKQWACATRVHIATSHRDGMLMPGSGATVTSLSDGMMSPRATTASLSECMTSPRATTASHSNGMTTPGILGSAQRYSLRARQPHSEAQAS